VIVNLHSRKLAAEPAEVGRLIDSLASEDDRLWPGDRWPPMRFDRPLGVGARGGHGFVRYRVIERVPGERVTFRFDPRIGVSGTHGFEVVPAAGGGSILRHAMEATAHGSTRLTWPLAIRWLHDACLEDALDRAEASLGAPPARPARWSPWVRLCRRMLTRRGGRPPREREPASPISSSRAG
jgi:hypothetical protein